MVGSISSGAAGTMSANLVGVGSFVGVSQLLYLFIVQTAVWGGTALSACFIILSALFRWKESSVESALHGWIFDKYLVFYQLFIKHQLCVGDLQSFPLQMDNLSTQCFY